MAARRITRPNDELFWVAVKALLSRQWSTASYCFETLDIIEHFDWCEPTVYADTLSVAKIRFELRSQNTSSVYIFTMIGVTGKNISLWAVFSLRRALIADSRSLAHIAASFAASQSGRYRLEIARFRA